MAQKDKVKELVGRGLHSYHTKALQQMDRIEKKNKEQNHKISILTNELDNDYLTKTEEGSVVSLEHSKEGMVYLDELQGNTLVNYCTDGSKEMTLNGDIDVEGTFVTTTEGVDNGKVDVMCKGNTLVNLIKPFNGTKNVLISKNENIYTWNLDGVQSWTELSFSSTMFKPNTKYTIVVNVLENTLDKNFILADSALDNWVTSSNINLKSGEKGLIIKTFTSKAVLPSSSNWYLQSYGATTGVLKQNMSNFPKLN